MTGLPRSRVVVSACVVLAWLALSPAVGPAQVFAPAAPSPGAGPDPVLLPTDRKTANQIKAAHEYIAAKDWDNAARLLQRVLDEPEDSLLESEAKDAQGNLTVLRTSAAPRPNTSSPRSPSRGWRPTGSSSAGRP